MRFFQAVFFTILTLTVTGSNATANQEHLEIVNLRVGQGDSTLILGPADSTGNRVTVLFDAGDISTSNFDGGNILRTVLWRRGITEIDYLILSHDDADHLGGVAFGGFHGTSFLLGFNNVPGNIGDDDGDGVEDWLEDDDIFVPDPEEFGTGDDVNVRHFVDYGDAIMRDDSKAIKKYQAFANAMGTRITINDQATVDAFEIDLGGGAVMTAYAANGFVRGRGSRVSRVNTPNERSLSFLISHGDFDFLLSGDLIGRTAGSENARVEEAVGHAIVANGRNVDVLHVNHHGANNASSSSFLDLIKPEIAIISAGNRNTHEHPSNDALERLVRAGVYRIIQTAWGTTGENIPLHVRDHHAIWQQDVIVRSDGKDYWLETSRKFSTDE